MRKLILGILTLSLMLMMIGSVSAATAKFYPGEGIDTTTDGSYFLDTTDLGQLVSNDDERYQSDGYWQEISFVEEEAIEFSNFGISIPSGDITSGIVRFDWRRNGNLEEARVIITDGSLSETYILGVPAEDTDQIEGLEIPTTFNFENIVVRFQAANGSSTSHDFVEIEVTYTDDEEAPEVSDITIDPEYPEAGEDVKICADVTDNIGISNVRLDCESLIHVYSNLDMNIESGDKYCTWFNTDTINGEVMSCTITAEDNFENSQTAIVPEFTYDGENPVADAGVDQTADEGILVTFNGAGSYDDGSGIASYLWDFGDDESSTEQNPTHVYADNGIYTVTLTVSDYVENTDSDTMIVTVENVNPVAEANGYYFGDEGSFVQLTGSATDVAVDELSYVWDLDGDANYETAEQNPMFFCSQDGDHMVGLQVTDDDLGIGFDTATITCQNLAPTVDSLSIINPINEEETTTLTASVSDAGEDSLEYSIDWGDGAVDTGFTDGLISAIHQYMDDNDYIVTLIVSDGIDDSAPSTEIVVVENVNPWNVEAGENQDSVIDEIVQFSGSGEDVVEDTLTYSWDFGDGNTGSGSNPIHIYSVEGTYIVTLTVEDEDGGISTDTATVIVYDYEIELTEGWNLISLPWVPEEDDTSIVNIFGQIEENIDVVWSYTYDETLGKNVWKYNEMSNGTWMSGSSHVQNIIPGYGYYVKMNAEDVIYLDGKEFYGEVVPAPPSVTLAMDSWNLVGTYGEDKDVYTALVSLTDESGFPYYDIVSGEDGENILEIGTMTSTEGYWISIKKIFPGEDSVGYRANY